MPRVSIILPVFNKEKYISKTLNTLINQNYKDWELIIVDDGSSDNSNLIINSFEKKDDRIKVISQENKGVSIARNVGLSAAKGEWIWFVDADDHPFSDFLFNVFNNDIPKDIGAIIGNYQCLNSKNQISDNKLDEVGYISCDEFPNIFMKYQYKNGFWGYLWNKLLRKDIILNNHLFFSEGLTLAEDLKFMISYYKCNISFLCIPEFAMRYTLEAVNSSKEKTVDYYAQLNIQMEIKKWIVDSQKCSEYIEFFRKTISYYAAFIIFYGYENNDDIKSLASTLINNQEVKQQLSTKNINSTMLPIVYCLKNNFIHIMNLYLITRNKLRKLYRCLKERR